MSDSKYNNTSLFYFERPCELTPEMHKIGNREGIISWSRNWISRSGFVSGISREKVWCFCGSHCNHGNFKQGKKPARIYSLQPSRNIRATSACNYLPWLKSWLDPLVAAYLEACIAWTNRTNILVARSTQKTLCFSLCYINYVVRAGPPARNLWGSPLPLDVELEMILQSSS